jgi:hypothetical protein
VLLYDDENQLDAANKYIALARNGPIFPEEKQLLKEIATRRKNAADSLTPSPSPSRIDSATHLKDRAR